MVNEVKKIIYTHGVYPMLMGLKHFQEEELYEQCIIIKQAIDEVSKGREQWHASSLSNENIDRTIDDLQIRHPIIWNNMWVYEGVVIKKLKELFKV